MKIIEPAPTEWSLSFTCEGCSTVAEAEPADLEAGEFKTSGYFFAGTAVCERLLYVVCPTCDKKHVLSDEERAGVPYLVQREGEANYEHRRAEERAAQ